MCYPILYFFYAFFNFKLFHFIPFFVFFSHLQKAIKVVNGNTKISVVSSA